MTVKKQNMEHIALEIFDRRGTESQFAALSPNIRIRIRRSSRVFGKGEVWTHNFALNVYANAAIFGTAGELHGGRLHEQIDKRKARLWVEGMPLYMGYLKLDDEVDVDMDGNVDVRFESGKKTFEQLIEGGRANQVPMLGDVQIGMALWRKRWVKQGVFVEAQVTFGDGAQSKMIGVKKDGSDYFNVESEGENNGTSTQSYPRLVYPKGEFYNQLTHTWEEPTNFLNTDSPYTEDEDGTPTNPYCNVALCYQRYGYEKKQADGSYRPEYSSEPEAQRGYEYMPANRVNSAPNFFVLYWIRALMTHLGIHIEENQMMDVEDLRRLFFVNTNCAYELPEKMRTATSFSRFGKYSSRDEKARPTGHDYVAEYVDTEHPFVKLQESKFECVSWHGEATGSEWSLAQFTPEQKTIEKVDIIIKKVKEWYEEKADQDRDKPLLSDYLKKNRLFHKAFATSECFPNADISDVINALESGFGIRFLFDDNYQRVRIVLLRNIFRGEDVQELKCNILSENKTENNIRGFRMTYGNSEDSHFYYKGFADKLPHQKEIWPDASDRHDYSQWDLNATYYGIINKVSAFDKTCYVTPNTGNAYGIKIDKDAKRYEELHPSAFEFAGFMDAEDGDCTGEEDTIETVTMGFTPAIMNDLNMDEERTGTIEQRFALFVDETMRPRRPDLYKLDNANKSYNDADAEYVASSLYIQDSDFEKMKVGGVVQPGLFAITSDMVAGANELSLSFSREKNILSPVLTPARIKWDLTLAVEGYINEGYRLYLQDNYEPNDDGISPIETHDWGLTFGIMRGSGSDAYINYTPDKDDGEGNDTWDIVSGSNATAHPDTCDSYGNLFDYNGSDGPTIHCTTPAEAKAAMQNLWPNSNIDLIHQPNTSGRTQAMPDERDINSYIAAAQIQSINNHFGKEVSLLFATATISGNLHTGKIKDYAKKFKGMTPTQMFAYDAGREGFGILVEVGSSMERLRTLLALQKQAFADGDAVIIDGGDNGVGVTEGRFSLKLRAEKLNPFFDPKQPESVTNRRYLEITNPNLRGRGLMDQFYKEYSYWVRNARIDNMVTDMGIAELMALDDTVQVKIGDVQGFIKEMEMEVDMQTGVQPVAMKVMYI